MKRQRGECRAQAQAQCLENVNSDSAACGSNCDLQGQPADQIKLSNACFALVLLAFGMALVSSQPCPLIFAALVSTIAVDLNAGDNLIWAVPMAGILASMVGMILCAATPIGPGFIAGQAYGSIGIEVQDLIAIAVIAEIVSTKSGGDFAALLVATFTPFTPGSLHGRLLAEYSWRYFAWLVAAGICTLPFGFCILASAITSALLLSRFRNHIHTIVTFFFLLPTHFIITFLSPDDLIATATSLTISLRTIGQVLGTSIFYNQFSSKLTQNAMWYFIPPL
ncbi:hypothetical protein BDV12DRAFT_194738 [Aspergillus spectabilis]